MPFYFLPYVGGMDTIRSFREFRFKDENALWLSGEYKWRLSSGSERGGLRRCRQGRADWQDVRPSRGMRAGYGFGVALHPTEQTFARVDVGTGGGEGWQLFLKFGPSF